MKTKNENSKAIIKKLGGCKKVCELMGIPAAGGVQRVYNWTIRGIPPRVQLDYPHLFLK